MAGAGKLGVAAPRVGVEPWSSGIPVGGDDWLEGDDGLVGGESSCLFGIGDGGDGGSNPS